MRPVKSLTRQPSWPASNPEVSGREATDCLQVSRGSRCAVAAPIPAAKDDPKLKQGTTEAAKHLPTQACGGDPHLGDIGVDGQGVSLEVSDDGKGIPEASATTRAPQLGVGIPGMQARVRQLAAALRAGLKGRNKDPCLSGDYGGQLPTRYQADRHSRPAC